MRVYHGGYEEVSEIDLSKSRDNLDFGKGFYVTNIRSQAEFWATRASRRHKTDGVVSEFEFYENAFEHYDLNVLRFSGYTNEWLDFVVLNRDPKTPIPSHNYDIVEGPVADDDVANRINDYLTGLVAKNDFLNELSFHKPTHQICFCTVRSLQMIEPIDKKYYVDVKHISKPIIETLIAEQGFDKNSAMETLYNSAIFSQLSNRNSELHKKAWQDIYELLKNEIRIDSK